MPQDTVVILLHGIRTAAFWQGRMAAVIENETGATVIPLKYGYFDLLRFLCPFRLCRNGPIERLRKQIQGIREQYSRHHLVVFAHSYGTYALSRILLENPYFKFNRIILCGSIVREDFDWSRVENQILSPNKRDAIINECGIRDVWPVIAKSTSWGYGASGTYGFGSFNVRDRFHPIGHSGYFTTDFVRQYWVPAVAGQSINFSKTDIQGAGTPFWFGAFRFPLRWLIVFGLPVILAFAALPALQRIGVCMPGKEYANGICLDKHQLKTKREIAERISNLLVDIKKTLDLKRGTLFPLMRAFLANPSDETWQKVLTSANELQKHVEKSLNEITTYDSHLVKVGNEVILIASDARIVIDEKYLNAFSTARETFESRDLILSSMMQRKHAPQPEEVREWFDKFTKMHKTLSNTLEDLIGLLDRA